MVEAPDLLDKGLQLMTETIEITRTGIVLLSTNTIERSAKEDVVVDNY